MWLALALFACAPHQAELDALAEHLREHLDIAKLFGLVELEP